jgi:tetratricopeptide (TPR) repeat protein
VSPAAEINPEERGNIFFAEDRYQAAIEAFKQVNPPTANAWNKMGISYQKMYNVDEARKCYEAAHKLEPTNVNYLNNLGTAYAGLNQFINAEKAYRKALKIDPKDALIYKNLGTLYVAQGRLPKAKKVFDQARELDPNIFLDNGHLSIEEPTSVHGRGAMNYMMARSCVQAGLTECALTHLRASINEGYTTTKKVEADPDFKPLLNVYAFQQMIAELNEKKDQSVGKAPVAGRPE